MLSFLFPRYCGICKTKINQKYTCEKCSNILKYTMKRELCTKNVENDINKIVSLFLYKGLIRNQLLALKFDGKAYIAFSFAELMLEVLRKIDWPIDIVIPVPISKKRYFERGYNQSELLSKFISKKLKIQHENKLLIKWKDNVAQSTLSDEERIKNVQNVYRINNKNKICGKNVLLVDDIYTTGATIKECARMLKQNGVKEIYCITIAHRGDLK